MGEYEGPNNTKKLVGLSMEDPDPSIGHPKGVWGVSQPGSLRAPNQSNWSCWVVRMREVGVS